MIDFTKSLEAGLQLAIEAERNRHEVDEVFNELNRQISTATRNSIRILREQFDEPPEDPLTFRLKRIQYWAISARHATLNTAKPWVLARWYQPIAGYPCKITTRETEFFCENKEALEAGLANLLATPEVGRALHSLMHLEAESAKPADG